MINIFDSNFVYLNLTILSLNKNKKMINLYKIFKNNNLLYLSVLPVATTPNGADTHLIVTIILICTAVIMTVAQNVRNSNNSGHLDSENDNNKKPTTQEEENNTENKTNDTVDGSEVSDLNSSSQSSDLSDTVSLSSLKPNSSATVSPVDTIENITDSLSTSVRDTGSPVTTEVSSLTSSSAPTPFGSPTNTHSPLPSDTLTTSVSSNTSVSMNSSETNYFSYQVSESDSISTVSADESLLSTPATEYLSLQSVTESGVSSPTISLLSSPSSSNLSTVNLRGSDSYSTSSTDLGTFPSLLSDLESEIEPELGSDSVSELSTDVGTSLDYEGYGTPLSLSRSTSTSSYTSAMSDDTVSSYVTATSDETVLYLPNRVEFPDSDGSIADFESIPGSFPSSVAPLPIPNRVEYPINGAATPSTINTNDSVSDFIIPSEELDHSISESNVGSFLEMLQDIIDF